MPKILGVDDDIYLQRLVYYFLSHKYEVETLSSAEEAVRYVQEKQVDILLLDGSFKTGISGLEAVEQIRKTHPHLPIIALTGSVSYADQRQFLEGGFSAFLAKPFSQIQLEEIVAQFL